MSHEHALDQDCPQCRSLVDTKHVAVQLANPISGLDLMANMLQSWSGEPDHPNISNYLHAQAQALRDALRLEKQDFLRPYQDGTFRDTTEA